ALLGGRHLPSGALEPCQERPARLVETPPLLGGLERPPRPIEKLHVELRLELLDRLARGRLSDAALGGAARHAPEADHVAKELERLELHRFQSISLMRLMQQFRTFTLG